MLSARASCLSGSTILCLFVFYPSSISVSAFVILPFSSSNFCYHSQKTSYLPTHPQRNEKRFASSRDDYEQEYFLKSINKNKASAQNSEVNIKTTRRRINKRAREIIFIIESQYDAESPKERQDNNLGTKSISPWSKTRNYIYHATSTKMPLTSQQVNQVLVFLEQTFTSSHHKLIPAILQTIPRILRKNVDSYLLPTVEFLRNLYPDEMFYKAIERNPNLLLTSGVGYDSKRSESRNARLENGKSANVETEKPSATEEGLLSIQDVGSFLMVELSLKLADVEKLKRSHPFVFQLSVEDKLRPIVHYLLSLFQPITRSMPNADEDKIRTTVRKIITTNPTILNLDLKSNLCPKVEFLRKRCGLDQGEITKVLKSCPGLLGLSIEQNLKPTIEFLELMCTGTKKDQDVPYSSKTILGNLDSVSKEVVSDRLRKCLLRHPQLLALSMKNLDEKKRYFDEIDSLSNTPTNSNKGNNEQSDNSSLSSLASKVFISAPSTFSLSLKDNIIPKVTYLANLWGSDLPCNPRNGTSYEEGTNGSTLVRRLGEYPTVLTLSLEGNIQPTINFYNQTRYIELDSEGTGNSNLRARYIATSLFNCLLPRWNYCRELDSLSNLETKNDEGVGGSDNLPANPGKTKESKLPAYAPPLHLLAGASDAQFCAQMNIRLEDYLSYKEDAKPRLKFSSQFQTWLKTGRPIDGI